MEELDNERVSELTTMVIAITDSKLSYEDKAELYRAVKRIAYRMSVVPCLVLTTIINYQTEKMLQKEQVK